MLRSILLLLVMSATFAAEKRVPPVQIDELRNPSAPGSVGAALFTAPDGALWLTWVELGAPASRPAAGGHHHGAAAASDAPPNTLRFAILGPAARDWSAARTIAVGHGVPASSADFPQLVVDATGRATVAWSDGRGGAFVCASADQGATWSPPAPLTRSSTEVEKLALTALADGRVLAAWLDGRAKSSGGPAQQLFAAVLGEAAPATLVDPSVCDCCQTTLTAFPDGGALLAYRGRTAEEIRDIRTARFDGRTWRESRLLNHDDWRIAACPINGPKLAGDLGRVGAVWFTAAGNEPRVLVSFSPDAGARFLQPLRIDLGHPVGHVDTLILRDTAVLVTWVENDGSFWLRRINPEFSANEPVALAPKGAVALRSFPRSALRRDYAGGSGTAQFVAAYSGDGISPLLHTLVVTVPEGPLLAAQSDCGCTPTPEQLAGISMRGVVSRVDANGAGVGVRHDEIPGVMAAGEHEFRVARADALALSANRDFFGRITQREGRWWLFDVRVVGMQPPSR